MKNKYKTVPWAFVFVDYKAMEEYLEEMAQKGWMLEKVRRLSARFRAIEPKNIKYYVDVFEGGGPLTSENTRDAKVYRRKCEELGWNFITSQDYFQFFYAEEDKEVTPIKSDHEEEFKTIKKTLVKYELLSIAIMIFALYRLIKSAYPIKYTNLLTYIGVFGTFMYPFLAISTLLMITYTFSWLFKNHRNIKKGLPLERPKLKDARRRGLAIYIPPFVFLVIFIFTIIMDSLLTPNISLVILLGPITGIGIGLTMRHIIKKKANEKGDGILYLIVSIIATVIIVNIGMSIYIRTSSNNTSYKEPVPEGYPIITMKDITQETNEDRLVSRHFKPGRSPIIPMNYDYWETWDIDGKRESIRISYYEIINPYFVDIVLRGKTEEINRWLSWKKTSLIKDDRLKGLYNVDNLLIDENSEHILIQKGNRVVHLSGDIDFNERDIVDNIIEMLLESNI